LRRKNDEAMMDDCWRALEQAIINEALKPENQPVIPALEAFFVKHNVPADEQRQMRGLVLGECWVVAIKQVLGLNGEARH
jgi:hypothetical protein